MPILALSALTGINKTTQGRVIAYSLTLVAMAILISLGQTTFKSSSRGISLTMTGIGVIGVDTIVAALALLIFCGIERCNNKIIKNFYKPRLEQIQKNAQTS
jgi:hypothetical protein